MVVAYFRATFWTKRGIGERKLKKGRERNRANSDNIKRTFCAEKRGRESKNFLHERGEDGTIISFRQEAVIFACSGRSWAFGHICEMYLCDKKREEGYHEPRRNFWLPRF